MERLTLRVYIVAGLLAATAVWAQFSARPGKVAGRTGSWMEQVAPAKVANYSFIPDVDPKDNDPLCSYKDDPGVYSALAPTVGILARVYQAGSSKYDVTLIASRDRISFHDPHVCFTAQQYNITDESQILIHTQTRGDIPATFAHMTTPDGQNSMAIYFYRGPHGFFATTLGLKMGLLLDQIKGKADLDAVFYRFIPEGDLDQNHLTDFIAMYMDKAGETSKNYF